MRAPARSVLEFAGMLAGVVAATFLFMHWLPGDPAELYAGDEATFEEIEAVRKRLGLDRPVPVQLVEYASRLLQGDLGTSIRSGRPVWSEIRSAWTVTLRLATLSSLIALVVALAVGLQAATRPRSALARLLEWSSLGVLALPVYWFGLLLILIFAVRLRILPPGGSETWTHLLLPAATLGIHSGAGIARILKASLLETLGRPYLAAAQGKGASWRRAVWVHALPNALIPVVAFVGVETGRLLGGAVLTETVFSVNGLGRYLVKSIAFRDYPAVVASVMIMALSVTAANFFADLLCRVLDPRTQEADRAD